MQINHNIPYNENRGGKMIISNVDIKEYFLIERINAPKIEIEALNMIGIFEGMIVQIIGEGYLKGSILVKNNDGLVIQLNPYFKDKLEGSIVKEKRLIK